MTKSEVQNKKIETNSNFQKLEFLKHYIELSGLNLDIVSDFDIRV